LKFLIEKDLSYRPLHYFIYQNTDHYYSLTPDADEITSVLGYDLSHGLDKELVQKIAKSRKSSAVYNRKMSAVYNRKILMFLLLKTINLTFFDK
jgi:hypothetical protein